MSHHEEKAREIACLSCPRCGEEPDMIAAITAALKEAEARTWEEAARGRCIDCRDGVPYIDLKDGGNHIHGRGREDYFPCSATKERARAAALRNGGGTVTEKFKVGDEVYAKGNYLDEQLGEFAPQGFWKITAVKRVRRGKSGSGLLVKTDAYHDWVDADWFAKRLA